MNDDQSTADTILDWMHKQAADKAPIDPILWLEAAIKLEILGSDETDHLIELESIVAIARANAMQKHNAATKAKVEVEALDIFKNLRLQQEKCKRIMEMVRLAKKYAQLKNDQMRNSL